MLTHEFALVKEQVKYCDPKNYTCISINDHSILSITKELRSIKTYRQKLAKSQVGLSYYGITIIPLESLNEFLTIVQKKKELKDFDTLLALIEKSIKEEKMMIHFGI